MDRGIQLTRHRQPQIRGTPEYLPHHVPGDRFTRSNVMARSERRPQRTRREEERLQARRQKQRRNLVIGGVAAVAVAAFALVVVLPSLSGASGGSPGPSAEGELPPAAAEYEVTERGHVQTPVTYPQTPPVGGNHAPVWQNCGYYSSAIANENGVHTLEHGAVWITYRPELPQDQIEALRQLTRGQTFVLVTPFPNLPSPIVASAWGRQLSLERADDPELASFIRVFRLGKQSPEPGAPCTGGLGQPQ